MLCSLKPSHKPTDTEMTEHIAQSMNLCCSFDHEQATALINGSTEIHTPASDHVVARRQNRYDAIVLLIRIARQI